MGGVEGETNGTMDGRSARATIVDAEGDLKLPRITTLHLPTPRITMRHSLPARQPLTTLATIPRPRLGHQDSLNKLPTMPALPTLTTTHQANPLRVDHTLPSILPPPITPRGGNLNVGELPTNLLVAAASLGAATAEEAQGVVAPAPVGQADSSLLPPRRRAVRPPIARIPHSPLLQLTPRDPLSRAHRVLM
jgi:hypothetical protein